MPEERRKFVRRQADRELLQRLKAQQEASMAQESLSSYRRKQRRHAIRHNCGVQIGMMVHHSSGGGDNWSSVQHGVPGRLLDLSPDGCMIFTHERFEVGQHLTLPVRLRDGAVIPAHGEVRWTRSVDKRDGYAAGVQFGQLEEKYRKLVRSFLKDLDETIGL